MKHVAIITDSTACVPPELAATNDIIILPLFLEFEDAVFEDGKEGSVSDFRSGMSTSSAGGCSSVVK